MLDSIIDNAKKEVKTFEKPNVKKVTKKKTAKKTTVKKAPAKKKEPVKKPTPKVPEVTEPTPLAEMEKHTLFSTFMDNVDTSKMKLTKAEIKSLQAGVSDITGSYNAIIRTCNPNCCKQLDICPFTKIKKYPVGTLCSLEKALADSLSKEYFMVLQEELGHDQYNVVEISTIHALIEVDLEEFRARVTTNSDGQLVRYAAFVVKDTGEIVYNDVEHPLYNLRERLDRRKSKLLQRLLITPESKARFKIEDKGRSGKKTEDLIQSAEEKIQQLKTEDLDGTKGSESSPE